MQVCGIRQFTPISFSNATPPALIRPAGWPTRTAKIRYLMRGRHLEAEVTIAHAQSLRAVHRQLEKVKHMRIRFAPSRVFLLGG